MHGDVVTTDVVVPLVSVHGSKIEARRSWRDDKALHRSIIAPAISYKEHLLQLRLQRLEIAFIIGGKIQCGWNGNAVGRRIVRAEEHAHDGVDRREHIALAKFGTVVVVDNPSYLPRLARSQTSTRNRAQSECPIPAPVTAMD